MRAVLLMLTGCTATPTGWTVETSEPITIEVADAAAAVEAEAGVDSVVEASSDAANEADKDVTDDGPQDTCLHSGAGHACCVGCAFLAVCGYLYGPMDTPPAECATCGPSIAAQRILGCGDAACMYAGCDQ